MQSVRMSLILLIALFIALSPATAATIVEEGQARAVIIVPEKPSPVMLNAAHVLQAHIKQMSEAELPIRTEDKITGSPSKDQAWILVGEGKMTEKFGLTSKGLGAGGIALSAKENVLAIIGLDTIMIACKSASTTWGSRRRTTRRCRLTLAARRCSPRTGSAGTGWAAR